MNKEGWMKSLRETGREAGRAAETRTGRRRPGPGRFLLMGVIGAAAGAAAAFLFDPDRGRSRRARYGDQAAALLRDAGRRIGRGTRHLSSTLEGKAAALRSSGIGSSNLNDASLAKKVESELFRDPAVPKGALNINVQQGVVVLRGEVPDAAMRERLESTVRDVAGVWEVENLLGLPETAAEPLA